MSEPDQPSPSSLSPTARMLVVVWILVIAALPLSLWLFRDRWFYDQKNPSGNSRTAAIPVTKFVEITSAAGIVFRHQNGAAGERLLPETMGGGCAIFDYDNDGDQDILLVNSSLWPWSNQQSTHRHTTALYRNDGTGRFEDVSRATGIDLEFYGMGVAVGDYDNDGFTDVFLTGVGEQHLLQNRNGKFVDVTAAAGVTNLASNWSTSAAWLDYDRDGDLDLFVCNYIRWSREIDLQVNYQLAGVGRAYGPPINFAGSFPSLYRNEGANRFTDVSARSGVQIKNPATGLPMAKSLGVAPVDLDDDGWIDLVVANDTVQNFVFYNQKNGTFKEMGAISGLAFDTYGSTRGAMGIDAGRFQDENTLGISIGNFANEMTALYVSQRQPLLFSDEAISRGIGQVSRQFLTFGVFFFDYDLDGWLDLLTVNGHVEPEIGRVNPGQSYLQSAQLFWNGQRVHTRSNYFRVTAIQAGEDLFRSIAGRGSAYGDIDGDGDLDVLMTQVGGPPMLLRNERPAGNRWIRLKLNGARANRDAIGSWVRLRTSKKTILRQVMPTRGYLSQSELPMTIGLGQEEQIQELTVSWSDGSTQKVEDVQTGKTTMIKQKVP